MGIEMLSRGYLQCLRLCRAESAARELAMVMMISCAVVVGVMRVDRHVSARRLSVCYQPREDVKNFLQVNFERDGNPLFDC